MRASTLGAAAFLVLAVGSSLAQETAESFVPNYAAGEAHFLWTSEATFDDTTGSFQNQEAGFSAPIPLHLGEEFLAVAQFRFRYNELNFDNFAPFASDLDLYRLQLPFNFWWNHHERWKFWLRVEPGLQSDMEHISSDDFTLSALALASYRMNERLRWALGVAYSNALGDEWILPAVGFIWEPNPRWNYSITVPRLTISYAPVDGVLYTLFANPSGASWNITNPNGGNDIDLDYSAIRIGLTAQKRLRGPLWGYLEGGYQFAQSLESGLFPELDAEGSGFAAGGVQLRF